MTAELVVADQQVLQGVACDLEWINLDGAGEPAAAGGAVSVVVTRADGTTLLTSGAANADTDVVGRYTRAASAANLATLDLLTATWTDAGDSSAHTTLIEIVGGFYFSFREATEWHPSLSQLDEATFTRVRAEAVEELEWITDRSFVPRFGRVTLDGTGEVGLTLPWNDLRTVTAVTVDGSAYGAGELAALHVTGRRLEQDNDWWPAGQSNVTVAVTYGLSTPPRRLKRALMDRFRQLVNATKSGIPDRATSFSAEQGGTFRLDQAGQFKTGFPDIDAVYGRYSARTQGDGEHAPGSAQVRFSMQPYSLFHR